MAVAIHPYKGYLNSLFNVYVSGQSILNFEIYHVEDEENEPIRKGTVSSNQPFTFKMSMPGKFNVKFSDGSVVPIFIEDGYKYGGGRFKRGYIFDSCPWVFIIMHDRTYFYNRDTQHAYVETISPDFIEEVSPEYIILGNSGQMERTLFSLTEQKPILCVSDIVYYNDKFFVWKEIDNDKTTLFVYSLCEQRCLRKQTVEDFVVDNDNKRIIFSILNRVETITIDNECELHVVVDSVKGKIIALYSPSLAISYIHTSSESTLFVYDIDNSALIKEISLKGHIAKVGQHKIIDIWQRQKAMNNFNLDDSGFPEAELSATYYEYDFFPCSWEIFFTEKLVRLSKFGNRNVIKSESCLLKSCIKGHNVTIHKPISKSIIKGDTICLYNSTESFVCNKTYSKGNYIDNCSIYSQEGNIALYKDSELFILSRNGFWDQKLKHQFDFSKFDQFGIIKNMDTLVYQTLDGLEVGKYQSVSNIGNPKCGDPRMRTDKYYVYADARKIKCKNAQSPMYLSESLMYGLTVNKDGVFLSINKDGSFEETQVLIDTYDTSTYHDVLFSEDGKQIMHRDGNTSIVLDFVSGITNKFDNLSFIKHINGIRPLFSMPSSLQPRLVNPVTKQVINCNAMPQFQFVSPKGDFYADTKLNEYIEYYNRENNQILSKKEYEILLDRFAYPRQQEQDSKEWLEVKELRKQFIIEHFEFFNQEYPTLLNNDKTGKHWKSIVLDEENDWGTKGFLDRLIGVRGMAVIRKSSDDSIVAKIELGEPLTFINYVSFSYDSRYIALAGYRDNNTTHCGLFIVYDLLYNREIIHENTRRAVWMTAFTKSNTLAAYTSDPNTFFALNESEYKFDAFESQLLKNRSFLTFSPDGSYFALSKQGYVSKYDINGELNYGWGHQPSSFVELRTVKAPNKQLISFTDLSDTGIADVATRKESVASVSFSNDNKRLMMVGNDGVVIIRNLHLDDYACE
jgi:hypothetical protein